MLAQAKRPQLGPPKTEASAGRPPELRRPPELSMPLPDPFAPRELESPSAPVQRKPEALETPRGEIQAKRGCAKCGASEATSAECAACSRTLDTAVQLETPPQPARKGNEAERSDPAERQADAIGARIARDLPAGAAVGDGRLDRGVQATAESHLGVSLEGAKLNAGSKAQRKARDERALAVTEGEEISFASGELDGATGRGKELLGHELVHVAQQRRARKRTKQFQRAHWSKVIPKATGLKAVPKQKLAPGEKPSLVVTGPDNKEVPATRPEELSAEAKAECDSIAANRKKFSPRAALKVQGPGYIYGGSPEHKRWYAGYAQQTNDTMTPRERAQRETFFDIAQKEGFSSSINTYEPPGGGRVTFGVGFASSGGELQSVLARLIKKVPELQGQLESIGILLTGKTFTVVDTARCLQLEGVGADYLIMVTPSLLEFLIQLAESTDKPEKGGEKSVRELVADAQFEQFIEGGRGGAMPNWAVGLPRDVRSFIAHAVHGGGGFSWGRFEDATTLPAAVARVISIKGESYSRGTVVASASLFSRFTRMAGNPVSVLEIEAVDPTNIGRDESRALTREDAAELDMLEGERHRLAEWLLEHHAFVEEWDDLAHYVAMLEADPDVLAAAETINEPIVEDRESAGIDTDQELPDPPSVRTYKSVRDWLLWTAPLRRQYDAMAALSAQIESRARDLLPVSPEQQLAPGGKYVRHAETEMLPKGQRPPPDPRWVYFWRVQE